MADNMYDQIKTVSSNIKRYRKAHNLTQKQLSDLIYKQTNIRISTSTLSAYERADQSYLRPRQIQAIADTMGVSTNDLISSDIKIIPEVVEQSQIENNEISEYNDNYLIHRLDVINYLQQVLHNKKYMLSEDIINNIISELMYYLFENRNPNNIRIMIDNLRLEYLMDKKSTAENVNTVDSTESVSTDDVDIAYKKLLDDLSHKIFNTSDNLMASDEINAIRKLTKIADVIFLQSKLDDVPDMFTSDVMRVIVESYINK